MNLDPEPVWNYFEEISQIPRCSKNEDEIRKYILSIANKHNLNSRQDEVGNIVIEKSGNINSDSPTTILQAHMDMVCDKEEGIDHDFSKDPIEIKEEDGWITANGTTLGADNGIGVAIALAVATSNDIEHGPLEFLFTVDEESGLTGAFGLKEDFLKGSKLINLDSEEFGEFTIGSAGGGDTDIHLPIETEGKVDQDVIQIEVTGLKGGHSGMEIDKGRGNAIKILNRLLWNLKEEKNLRIKSITGGEKHNAIPRNSKATITTQTPIKKVKKLLNKEFKKIKNEYKKTEENMSLKIDKIKSNERTTTLNTEATERVINLIQALPHGVLAMDQKINDLVRTSTNLAIITKTKKEIKIIMSTRSSLGSELKATRNRIRTIAKEFNATIEEEQPYPGWEPNKNSDLLKTLEKTYENTFNEEPKIKAIHAGLETGIIGKKYPNMELISVGPDIRNPHTPEEKVKIETVQKFWNLLTKTLKVISEKEP